eukprot:c24545_g1_i2 orf=586-1470(-)
MATQIGIPPPFQESSNCAICFCTFSAFKRRHHCRCCGRSLCSEHSSCYMELPQFGINTEVRVCLDCFESARQTSAPAMLLTSDEGTDKITPTFSGLNLSSDDSCIVADGVLGTSADKQVFSCSCGMPLCICQDPSTPLVSASIERVTPVKSKKSSLSSFSQTSTSSKASSSSSYGNSFPSLFFVSEQTSNGCNYPLAKNYEPTGEGMREAIKNGDVEGVKYLLMNGVDPNYFDKQGMSLLHIAAVFNMTQIAFLLMEGGAKVDAKNSQGETPLDCAQATLQYKMHQKVAALTKN